MIRGRRTRLAPCPLRASRCDGQVPLHVRAHDVPRRLGPAMGKAKPLLTAQDAEARLTGAYTQRAEHAAGPVRRPGLRRSPSSGPRPTLAALSEHGQDRSRCHDLRHESLSSFSKNRRRRIDAPAQCAVEGSNRRAAGRARRIDGYAGQLFAARSGKSVRLPGRLKTRRSSPFEVGSGAARLGRGVALQYPLLPTLGGILNGPMRAQGGVAMPVYEYHCDKCRREVQVTQSISEHGKGAVACRSAQHRASPAGEQLFT